MVILASWSRIASMVKKADVVLEVADARDPVSTRSPKLERMVDILGGSLLIVVNKIDLLPSPVVFEWKSLFKRWGLEAVFVSATGRMGTRILRKSIRRLAGDKSTITAVVVGYPKVGKSSIINALKGRHSAPTSPVPGSPGYTKHFQLYRIDERIYLIDSPGIIPVEGGLFESVIRGKSPEELKDPVPAAVMLIERALKYNPNAVKNAYGIDEKDPYKILELLALKRGWRYKSTGEPLIEEAARTVIRDYHKAKLFFYVPPSEYKFKKIRGRNPIA